MIGLPRPEPAPEGGASPRGQEEDEPDPKVVTGGQSECVVERVLEPKVPLRSSVRVRGVRDEPTPTLVFEAIDVTSASGRGDAPVTHESPLVAVVRRHEPYLPAQPSRTTGRAKREPAPLGLRVLVVFLALVLGLSGGGLAVHHYRPTWFRSHHQAPPRIETVSAVSKPTFQLLSSSGTTIRYSVPSAAYSVVVLLDQRCWTVIEELGHPVPVVASVLEPSTPPHAYLVTGESSVSVAARAVAVEIEVGSEVVGSVQSPRLGVTYLFQPARR